MAKETDRTARVTFLKNISDHVTLSYLMNLHVLVHLASVPVTCSLCFKLHASFKIQIKSPLLHKLVPISPRRVFGILKHVFLYH